MNRMFVTEFRTWATSDWMTLCLSLVASASAYVGEILTAAPAILAMAVTLYLKYKKFMQAYRHREELHDITKKLLSEGKDAPDYNEPEFE